MDNSKQQQQPSITVKGDAEVVQQIHGSPGSVIGKIVNLVINAPRGLVIILSIIALALIVIAGANVARFPQILTEAGWLPANDPPLFPAAQAGETLIVVVPFFRPEGIPDTDEAYQIQQAIKSQQVLQALPNLRVELAEGVRIRAEAEAEALALAQRYGASMVIWGSNTGVEVKVNYRNLRQPDFANAAVSIEEEGETGRTPIANPPGFAGLVTRDLPGTMSFFALFALGQAALLDGNTAYATQVLQASVDALAVVPAKPTGSAQAYFTLGWLYSQQPDFAERVIPAYTEAITIDPTYSTAYYNRGNAYLALGQRESAFADFSQAITTNPQLAVAYYSRGNLLRDQGQRELALADYTHAITLDPQLAIAYYDRANLYKQLGQTDRALTDYNAALQYAPNLALAHYDRGNLYRDRGEFALADQDYTAALTSDPDLAIAYYDRGNLYKSQGDQARALQLPGWAASNRPLPLS
jgi:tetratricopeptide (TPR) repeat protein